MLAATTALVLFPASAVGEKKHKKGKKKRKKKPARLLSAGAFYSPFVPGSSMVFPIHTDSRISGGGFIDTAVNNNSGGTLTVQSQAMCF